VLGQFVQNEEGRVFTVHAIGEAEARWDETPATGRTIVGVDPAGSGGEGDETVFVVRRGRRVLRVVAMRGISEEAIVVHARDLTTVERGEGIPLIVVDRDGTVGARVWGAFVVAHERDEKAFELKGVRAGEAAMREPLVYDRVRDELVANLERWMRTGAIPSDTKLAAELAEFKWVQNVSGRSKATPKNELRKILGRSPDRADALALAAWGSDQVSEQHADSSWRARSGYSDKQTLTDTIEFTQDVMDPYAALDQMSGGRRRR
jgi:hypothetical protein